MGWRGRRGPPGSSSSFRSVDVHIVSGRKRERDRRTGRKESPFASRLYQTWKRNPADGSALRDKDGWVQDQQRVCEENFGDRRREGGGQEIESGGVGGGGVCLASRSSFFVWDRRTRGPFHNRDQIERFTGLGFRVDVLGLPV